MPPTSRTIDEEGVLFDGVQIVARRRAPRGRGARAARRAGRFRRAIPTRTSPTSKRSSPRTRAASWSSSGSSRASAFAPSSATCGTCRTTPRLACAPRSRGLRDGRFTVELDGGERICVAVSVDATRRARDGRLRGHLARERRQLQRADVDRARGRAVRVPHAGPREHSAERRLPRAADDRAAGPAACSIPRYPGRGRGRQRRDVAVHHRRAARRARRLRGQRKAR